MSNEVNKIKEWEDYMVEKYNLTAYIFCGCTERSRYYVGLSEYRGEIRCVILQMNKNTGYITGFFSIPLEVTRNIAENILKLLELVVRR